MQPLAREIASCLQGHSPGPFSFWLSMNVRKNAFLLADLHGASPLLPQSVIDTCILKLTPTARIPDDAKATELFAPWSEYDTLVFTHTETGSIVVRGFPSCGYVDPSAVPYIEALQPYRDDPSIVGQPIEQDHSYQRLEVCALSLPTERRNALILGTVDESIGVERGAGTQ
jgi:hypothetical protein